MGCNGKIVQNVCKRLLPASYFPKVLWSCKRKDVVHKVGHVNLKKKQICRKKLAYTVIQNFCENIHKIISVIRYVIFHHLASYFPKIFRTPNPYRSQRWEPLRQFQKWAASSIKARAVLRPQSATGYSSVFFTKFSEIILEIIVANFITLSVVV